MTRYDKQYNWWDLEPGDNAFNRNGDKVVIEEYYDLDRVYVYIRHGR